LIGSLVELVNLVV